MDAKRLLELYHRGQTGKKISKEDWDIEYVVETVMELVDDYDLVDWNRSYDEQIIPEDDEGNVLVAEGEVMADTDILAQDFFVENVKGGK